MFSFLFLFYKTQSHTELNRQVKSDWTKEDAMVNWIMFAILFLFEFSRSAGRHTQGDGGGRWVSTEYYYGMMTIMIILYLFLMCNMKLVCVEWLFQLFSINWGIVLLNECIKILRKSMLLMKRSYFTKLQTTNIFLNFSDFF